MKIGWVVGAENHDDSCFLARVYRPHLRLIELGHDSRIYVAATLNDEIDEREVVIFHRTRVGMDRPTLSGAVLGLDLSDDLFRYEYASMPLDFIMTDSLPNLRFYLGPNTHYWPHGFPDLAARATPSTSEETRFVYCGAPENVHCLLGPPLEALESVGCARPISLRIITDLRANREQWVGRLPQIAPRNYKLEWMQFEQGTHEALMQECDAGLFPQSIEKDRWRKKSIYKPTHAASLGLPCIASPTEEAMMNLLDQQTALIPRTDAEWRRAVEAMCDPGVRASLRKNTVDLFRLRFTVDLVVQQLLCIIELSQKRRRSRRLVRTRKLLLRAAVAAERLVSAVERRLAR